MIEIILEQGFCKLKIKMWLLGKVNLEAMLVSCFPSYSRGGPIPLAGAPRDSYTQLLACSSIVAGMCFPAF